MQRTKVYLTIDVECAEERGRLMPALGYEVRVWGRLANQTQALGLPLIVRELQAHGFRATFFVEALGSRSFGAASLREVCQYLRDTGQDVQLHLHPAQRDARYRTYHRAPLPDKMSAYTLDEQEELLRQGLACLEEAGVPREELVAFRAGSFAANGATWRAMKKVGLPLSSNYNPCYRKAGCDLHSEWAGPDLFQPMAGLWELPIGNLYCPAGGYRHMQITAVSHAEMQQYLRQCRQLGIGHAVVLTHSFEFFHLDRPHPARGRVNRINVRRLRLLLSYLRNHPQDFEVETVGQLARRLPHATSAAARPYPQGSLGLELGRWLAQAVKRGDRAVGQLK